MSAEESQVVDINDRSYWSLSQLSKAFGPARETIAKRLSVADVHATKKRAGHDVYHIAQAAQAILAGELPGFSSIDDPDELQPKDRLDWYKGENEKTKYLREAGHLIPAGEVTQALAKVVKSCIRTIETLPDILEMKCRLPSDVVLQVELECDSARESLAKQLVE